MTMKTEISDFDASEYLTDKKSVAEYLTAVMEENDTKLLLAAIGDIAKAQGMSKIASECGLGRESLYKALNAGAKPRFDTVLKVLEALGVNISFSPKASSSKKPKVRIPTRKNALPAKRTRTRRQPGVPTR